MSGLQCILYAILGTIALVLGAVVLAVITMAIVDEYQLLRRRHIAHNRRLHPPPWRRLRT